MAIKHTAVSYYGFNYVEHAEKDFIEMKEHGCDTVILAITEFDMDFWFPNINEIVKTAHKVGLRCIADTWGIGKYFESEQVNGLKGYTDQVKENDYEYSKKISRNL